MVEFEATIEEIEQVAETKVVNSHACSWNAVPGGVFILQAAKSDSYPKPTWLFVSIWRADEGDVAMGEAEHLGEISDVSTFSIIYCPYCGEQLTHQE